MDLEARGSKLLKCNKHRTKCGLKNSNGIWGVGELFVWLFVPWCSQAPVAAWGKA